MFKGNEMGECTLHERWQIHNLEYCNWKSQNSFEVKDECMELYTHSFKQFYVVMLKQRYTFPFSI
jgi:hypothetical protein